jgi:hypothetical protein
MTRIGNVGSYAGAEVDVRGRVTTWSEDWSVDWWIHSDDAWKSPANDRKSKMAQRLVDAAPVVETTMRVGRGNVRHRAYAIAGIDEFVVVEITNNSPVPLGIALAIRPRDPDQSLAVEVRDANLVYVAGRVALVLPRQATSVENEPHTYAYPLPHTATIRFLMPLVPSAREPVLPTSVPGAEQVANGWQSHAGQGMRLVLPVPAVQEVIDADRMRLLLRRDVIRDPTHVVALDRYGFHREAAEALASYAGRQGDWPDDGSTLWTLAEHWRLTHDEELLRATIPAVARGATTIARLQYAQSFWNVAGLDAASMLLNIAREEKAARKAAAMAENFDSELWLANDINDLAVRGLVGAQPQTPAQKLLVMRAQLIRERVERGALGIDLLTVVPDAWLGHGVEVHDAPTHHGRLSYAVRWHGERPALLWELEPSGGAAVTIRIPGLDPSFAVIGTTGDALLAPVAPRGTGP